MKRRNFLVEGSSLGLASALAGCESGTAPTPSAEPAPASEASRGPGGETPARAAGLHAPKGGAIFERLKLGPPPWRTFDPFLFCVHHRDHYPTGNERLGPTESLSGRNIGQDFAGKDGWNMYHGDVVPGFPRHPHRGFETVTITRRGYVDHSDSLGATARYGEGDVQWMTAGRGIVHAEMFPLLRESESNPAELFQIWLNLPRRDKFAPPHFSMLWRQSIPRLERLDDAGRRTRVTVIAGALDGARPPEPPPKSWASRAEAQVSIWSLVLEPGARFELPAAARGVDRTLYFFAGDRLTVSGETLSSGTAARLLPERAIELRNGDRKSEVLLLGGRPIAEPVVKHGPFVMNDESEIRQAVLDYRKTGFGGWPWPKGDPVHPRESGRFAVHADGRRERG